MAKRKKKTEEKAETFSQAEDMALKSGMGYFGEKVLPQLGVKEKVLGVVPTEKVRVEAKKMYEDFTYRMDNGQYYHFEFESDKVTQNDLRRFREYEAYTGFVNKVDVVTHVICTAGTNPDCLELRTGINTYRVKATYLAGEKAEEVFARLHGRKTEELKQEDLLEVIFSPVLGGEMSKRDRVMEGISILRSATTVTKVERSRMEAILYILAVKFLDKSDLEEVKEKMAMTLLGEMIFQDGVVKGKEEGRVIGKEEGRAIGKEEGRAIGKEEGRAIGKEEGRAIGKEEGRVIGKETHRIGTIRKKRMKGLEVPEITEILEEEEAYVRKAVELLAENPGKSDLEIAQKMMEERICWG